VSGENPQAARNFDTQEAPATLGSTQLSAALRFFRRGIKLSKLISEARYRRAAMIGVAAAVEHTNAIRSLEPATLIDVGANTGQFSLLAKTIHPNVVIHAFEPLPGAAKKFLKLFAADSSVHLHPVAVGASRGTADLHVSRRADSSSLLAILPRQSAIFPGTEELCTTRVTVSTVPDTIDVARLSRPVLLKLDIQGFELEALKGLGESIRFVDTIYTEVSFTRLYDQQVLAAELVDWLSRRGFDLSGAYNLVSGPNGESIQADFLFHNREPLPTPSRLNSAASQD
jgi:FkbM family methyltransferase